MKNIIIFSIVILTITSCTRKKFPEINNDLEKNLGWINTNTISNEKFHSGSNSSKLDSVSNFGIGYSELFNAYNLESTTTIKVKFFTMFPKKVKEAVVCLSIETPDKKGIYWDGVHFEEANDNIGNWVDFSKSFNIPKDKIKPENRFVIYFWSPKGSTFYVDDVKILFF